METKEFEHFASGMRELMLAKCTAILGDPQEAEDATQEAMLKLWSCRDKIPLLESPRAYAATMARNTAISMLRARKGEEALDEGKAYSALSPYEADTDMENSDCQATIDTIFSRLPTWQQSILRLKHIEGYEIRDIAALLSCSEGSVRTTLIRARANIKNIFTTLSPKL